MKIKLKVCVRQKVGGLYLSHVYFNNDFLNIWTSLAVQN